MKAKWGDEFTYKIIQVFVVTKLDDVEPGTTLVPKKKVHNKTQGKKKKARVFDERSVRLTAEVERHATSTRDEGTVYIGRDGSAKQFLNERYQKIHKLSVSNSSYVSFHFRSTKNNALRCTSVFVCPHSGECFPSGTLISVNDAGTFNDSSLNWYTNMKTAMAAAAGRAEDNFCSRDGQTSLHQFCTEPTYSTESDILSALERFKLLDGTAAESLERLKSKTTSAAAAAHGHSRPALVDTNNDEDDEVTAKKGITNNVHRNHYCNENHIKHHWNQYNDNSRNGRQNSNFGNTNNYHNNDRYQHQGAKHYYQNQRNSDISDGGGGGYNSGYHHHQYDNYQPQHPHRHIPTTLHRQPRNNSYQQQQQQQQVAATTQNSDPAWQATKQHQERQQATAAAAATQQQQQQQPASDMYYE